MAYKIIPEDFTSRLTRIRAELARRNGYGDLSGYATLDFPSGTPITVGTYITAPVFNTLRTGVGYINQSNLPAEAVALETYINSYDLTVLDALLSAFEAQPRSATSGNDCASQCSGMCVTQCTTTCLSTCTGGCEDGCSTTCTGGCTNACTSCTGCTGCSGTCTGSCSGTCTGGCSSCTGGCWLTCMNTCKGTCSATCADGCSSACSNTCSGTCSSVAALGGSV